MSRPKITRRRLLIGFAVLGGGAYYITEIRFSAHQNPLWPTKDLLRLFGTRQGVLALGRLYLERYPEEADEARLIDEIVGADQSPPESAEALVDFLRMRIELDYEQGSVFLLQHWRLSRTEGRLWALASLGRTRS